MIVENGNLFLDTSALVKHLLYPDIADNIEPGITNLGKYLESSYGFRKCTDRLCVVEALGVIKMKYLRKINNKCVLNFEGYQIVLGRLQCKLQPTPSLNLLDFNPFDRTNFEEILKIIKKYKLDFIDASQIVLLKSKDVIYKLITGDTHLEETARKEGIEVWNCIKNKFPS
ncbi:hypothetical protein ACFLZV_06440 [Candidatus Margulisiibacteriota bacterium]